MPAISIFTPSHETKYLDALYESLKAQDFDDWEWVVLLNGEKTPIWKNPLDQRVNVVFSKHKDGLIGALKREAVEHCTAPILVEVDHDDQLTSTALTELLRAFEEHPDAGMVYSNFSHMDEYGQPDFLMFDRTPGWKYQIRNDEDGQGWLVPDIMAPTPHNVSQIWWAPNHVRAFTLEAYDNSGGYDPELVVLDDLDLMAKLYKLGPFVPIDKMLYKQRIHPTQSQKSYALNAQIQEDTWTMYEKNIKVLAALWSFDNDLKICDTGEGGDLMSLVLSSVDAGGYGLIRTFDLDCAESITGLKPKDLMMAIHHSLAPNGMFLSMTAYWGADFFNQFTKGDNPLFQVSRKRVVWYDGIPYYQANLIALKEGGTRDGGPIG